MAETRAQHHLRADGSARRSWLGPLLAALALGLVALIGLGSGAPLWDIGGPPRLADPSSYSGDLVVVGFALLVVLPFVVSALTRKQRGVRAPNPDLPPARVRWWVRVLAMLSVPVAVLLALLMLSVLPGAPHRKVHPRVPGRAQPFASADRRTPPVHWWGYTMLALIACGAVATVWYARAHRPEPLAEPYDADELLAAVDLSLDDLERDPDARRAVIRAYARMERALGSYGLARRPAETPLEYLARALTALRVGRASVSRLTALFERAKFSQHEIDVSMKTDAIAALGALRDELAGAEA